MVLTEGKADMNIIPVKYEAEAPSPHYYCLGMTPEEAAVSVAAKFGQDVPAVYVRQGAKRLHCYIPITVTPAQMAQAMSNEV